jgi:hypothetical protein
MITEVIMKRELFGCEIAQKSKSEFFSATDLVKAGNKWRILNDLSLFNLSMWLKNESTQSFIVALKQEFGEVISIGRGSKSVTWVHPFLFIDIALAINPKLKIEVYKWLYDHLLKYRNNSGDSYKKMAGALLFKYKNKSEFPKYIIQVASRIKNRMGIKDWNEASEKQLEQRDKIHEAVSLLSNIMTDTEKMLEIAFTEILGG